MNLEEYENLLKITQSAYSFEKINHNLNPTVICENEAPVCFLRHDIDFSPKNALDVARLEHSHGIQSTFTVLLSGLYYNPFEVESRNALKQISDLGHEVGLHFDPTCYNIESEEELGFYIEKEARIIEYLLEFNISMFSFHNTTDFSMNCRSDKYGGLVNAYSSFFHEKVEYTSDSNGYWRFKSWREILQEKHKIIQVLTHPIWWQPKNDYPPFETVIKSVLEKSDAAIIYYTSIFDGQSVRINHSALNDWLVESNQVNSAKVLNEYAKNCALSDLLRNAFGDESSADLKNAAKDFIDQ